MAYTLLGSERSPFVRACRMLMIRHGIPFEFRVLNFVDDPAQAAALAKETPINKVPVLIDDGRKIFDSRVIVNYLTRRHGWRPLSLDEENYVSAVYGGIESAVALFLLRREGLDVDGSPSFFFARNRARIPEGLKYVTPWASRLDPAAPGDWNYASMSLFSFLHWGEFRTGVIQVADYPELAAFKHRFAEAAGVRETSF